MSLLDDDQEYFRQLAWIYPVEYVNELKLLAEELLKEQLPTGERQNIREIVYNIMEKIKTGSKKEDLAAEDSLRKNGEFARMEAQMQAQTQALYQKVTSLLAMGQAELLAGFGPSVVSFLAEALLEKDAFIAKTACEALSNLEDGGTIDAFCQLWEDTRRPDLANILTDKGYLAARPLKLRVLSILKTGAASYMLAMDEEALKAILTAADDDDRQIASRAEDMLISLTDRGCIDAFCQMALDNPENERLLSWVIKGGYAPADPARAALFYCLTGQWRRYHELERREAGRLLQKGYAGAAKEEKEAFLSLTIKEGHSRLAVETILSCQNQGREESAKISIPNQAWDAIVENIASQKDWEFLYHLLFQTPPGLSVRIILLLARTGWNPPRPKEWRELLSLCPGPEQDLFMPDGRKIAELVLDEAGVELECLAFHPGEAVIAAGGSDGMVRLWSLDKSLPWRSVRLSEQGIIALAFAENGRFLVTASAGGKVNSWNMPAVTWAGSVIGRTGMVSGIAINNDGQILAAAKDNPSSPVVRVWHWDGSFMTNKAIFPQSIFTIAAICPGLDLVLGAEAGGRVRAWPVGKRQKEAGRKFSLGGREETRFISIAGADSLMAAITANNRLNIWSIDNNLCLSSLPVSKVQAGDILALSRKGDLAAVADRRNSTIALYQTRWVKPLSCATHADRQYAEERANLEKGLQANACKFLSALLNANTNSQIKT